MAEALWFFEGFKKSVLCGFVHGVGWTNDEKTISGFATVCQSDEFANLVNGNNGTFGFGVGFEGERLFEIYFRFVGQNENGALGACGDCGNLFRVVEKH